MHWPWCGALLRSTSRQGLFPALHFQVPLEILSKATEVDNSMYEICVVLMIQMPKGKRKISTHLCRDGH